MSFTAGFRLFFTTTSSSIWIGEAGRLVAVVETRRDGTVKSVSICGGRIKSSASKSKSLYDVVAINAPDKKNDHSFDRDLN